MRIERDSLGKVEVPEDALWGAQTQRALINFSISNDLIPLTLIHALAEIKQAAAISNFKLGVLNEKKKALIVNAAKEITEGNHSNQFPLKIWQTGSGTQTNMNMNEVISNLASLKEGQSLGSHRPLHPNDDVNMSQSTNDIFPSAIHIATVKEIKKRLLPELKLLIESFNRKSQDWENIIKIGRTHLQDAVPITLGQEASAWHEQIHASYFRISSSIDALFSLPIGGTAVGTGLNTPVNFDKKVISELSTITELPFQVAKNKFVLMASHDDLVNIMTQLKVLAVSLLKIANDIRFLSSGPRAGIGELELPSNEPGSSIMPGKINPTQCEAMAMVCTQVIALDTSVSLAGCGGHLQMNSYKPLIGFNILKSIELLKDACYCFRTKMIDGIKPNQKKMRHDLEQSLMLVTALSPKIGYEKASQIAHLAHQENLSLKQACLNLKYLKEEEFDKIVNVENMTTPNNQG